MHCCICTSHLQYTQNPATEAAKIEFKNRLKVDFKVDCLDLSAGSLYLMVQVIVQYAAHFYL